MASREVGAILVTGATGRQGGAVVRHLLARGFRVRALCRDPTKPAAKALATRGIEVVRGDLDDFKSLRTAMDGVDGAFSVQNWWETGATREIQQGKNVADAARAVGLRHLVYSSVGGADRSAPITHWQTKWQIECHIRELALPATILRPASFMETYYIPAVEKGILGGTLRDPIRREKRYQLIATDDIGAWAALAFSRPETFLGRALEIAGDELTNPQIAATFSEVLGRPVKFRRLPLFLTRVVLGKEFYQMFKWFNEEGYRADIRALKSEHPEAQVTPLRQWLQREGWAEKGTLYKRHARTFEVAIPKAR
jgi:uncharacterized protein YbjT (DUF2867 family)